MYNTISYEVENHVCLVGLKRPEKRNAFSVEMLIELARAYTEFEGDTNARVLLLHAHGDHFTGGLDLKEVGPHVAAGGSLCPENCVDPLGLFGLQRSKPVVVAVQGWCFTIGIELCLASDIVLVSPEAKFTQLEVARGIMPFGGATLRFPKIAGWGNAMRWMLTGEVFDAKEALRIGIAQEIVATREQLLEKAKEVAGTIAAQAPLAVQATLRSSRVAAVESEEAALEELMKQARKLMETEDAREGMLSFIERRKANFRGQ